jgi:hypothetical protein
LNVSHNAGLFATVVVQDSDVGLRERSYGDHARGRGETPIRETAMARKTNYKFEKLERERRKAEKKAAKAEAKKAALEATADPLAAGDDGQTADSDVENG